MTRPVVLSFDQLSQKSTTDTVVWTVSSIRKRVEERLPYPVVAPNEIPPGTRSLIAIGGGTLLDLAKAWRADNDPELELIAVPSLWGSGAETSPVVVLNVSGEKSIRMNDRFLPDKIVFWTELCESIPEATARMACGDCWSHALEGFLSPLADDSLRIEVAGLLGRMLAVPVGNDPRWFALSGEACAAQAQSSVGLVHGIAHTLEWPLRTCQPEAGWGHAKLCSTFLWPVMEYNRQASDKWRLYMQQYDIDEQAVLAVIRHCYDKNAYAAALESLKQNWRAILRDQCTRTNSSLVRSASLEYFETWGFE